jgi:hypothetical protein
MRTGSAAIAGSEKNSRTAIADCLIIPGIVSPPQRP